MPWLDSAGFRLGASELMQSIRRSVRRRAVTGEHLVSFALHPLVLDQRPVESVIGGRQLVDAGSVAGLVRLGCGRLHGGAEPLQLGFGQFNVGLKFLGVDADAYSEVIGHGLALFPFAKLLRHRFAVVLSGHKPDHQLLTHLGATASMAEP